MKSQLSQLNADDILKLLPIEKPIALGELAQQGVMLKVDETIFERNLTICAEKFDNIATIVKNSNAQLAEYNEKVVVIDVDHTFGEYEPIRFKRDFKLPLNAKMIDYIYDNDLDGVDATSKAVIQDIFYEVQEYTKTIDGNFIPFDTFLKVVSQQYEQTNIPELALLKHKLLKYREENVFAETKEELEGLKNAVSANKISYIDIADVSDKLQKELIAYIHSSLDIKGSYMYVFVKITNKNSDKRLLRQLLDSENIFTTIICSHNYKYLPELKQKAENLIFFAPQTVQHDFASYNSLLNKLNSNEFIVCGLLTQNVPLIVELNEFNNDIETSEEYDEDDVVSEEAIKDETVTDASAEISVENIENENATEDLSNNYFDLDQNETNEDIADLVMQDNNDEISIETDSISHDELIEQVAKDVDEVFYTKPAEIPSIEEISSPDNLTEDDLDFIGNLSVEADIQNEGINTENNDKPFELETIAEEPESGEYIQPLEEIMEINSPEDDVVEEVITEEPVLEDVPTEFEIENEPEDTTSDDLMDDPQPPVVPIYPSDEPILGDDSPVFEQGDTVSHPKYGRGVIEKLIKYGNKTLCSISFENVGRRLLDPAISELQKF